MDGMNKKALWIALPLFGIGLLTMVPPTDVNLVNLTLVGVMGISLGTLLMMFRRAAAPAKAR